MPYVPSIRHACAILLLMGALSACARPIPAGRQHEDKATRESRSEPPVLYIENRHWADVTIWALTGGQRNRIGTVGAASVAEFAFPPATMNRGGEMRLMATALASRRPYTSELFVVRPGGIVEWKLESRLERSFLSVY